MKRETRRYGIAFAVLLVLLGGLLIWNLNAGSFPMKASQVLAILFGQGGDETASRIVWDIRLPRILGAAFLGGALSISGFLLQTFFANPIASPFVLGISSGAKLAVALTMIFLLQRGILSNSFVLIGSAFVGAMLSVGLRLLVSQKVLRMSAAGDLRNYGGLHLLSRDRFRGDLCRRDANIVNLHNWSVGSFSGITWSNLGVIAGTVGLAVLLGLLSVQANGRRVRLGESYAQVWGFPSAGFAWS
ncbi:MAG: iron chelate uptake ABC transporter family permease subunit [Evtepia gabavorous]